MPASSHTRTIACALIAVVAAGALVGYVWDLNGSSLDFSDTQALVVVSGSMDGEPRGQYEIERIPVESLVLVREVPDDPAEALSFYGSLKVGDVLTFDYSHPVSGEGMIVTHRIVDISESDGVYTYTLQGDTMADDHANGSVQIVTSSSGDVIGQVVGVSHWIGMLTVFVSHWYGKAVLILIPCLILISCEVRNIVRVIRGGGDGARRDEA